MFNKLFHNANKQICCSCLGFFLLMAQPITTQNLKETQVYKKYNNIGWDLISKLPIYLVYIFTCLNISRRSSTAIFHLILSIISQWKIRVSVNNHTKSALLNWLETACFHSPVTEKRKRSTARQYGTLWKKKNKSERVNCKIKWREPAQRKWELRGRLNVD